MASLDYPNYDPNQMSAVINYWAPESLGLADNSTFGVVLSALWNQVNSDNEPSEWVPAQPTAFSGTTISITSDGGSGSIVTISVPVSLGTIGTTGNVFGAAVLSNMAGALAYYGAWGLCGAFLFGFPTNDSWDASFGNASKAARAICGSLATSAWNAIGALTNLAMTSGNAPGTPFPYASVLAGVIGATIVGAFFPFTGVAVKAFQYMWIGVAVSLSAAAGSERLLNWLLAFLTADQIANITTISDTLVNAQISDFYNPFTAAGLLGFWRPVASGYVGNVPSGQAVTVGSGDCMDAYGSNVGNEPAAPPSVPGQIVAINTCNGNDAQVFTFWPNGQIEDEGLCMDQPVYNSATVNLQWCDGSYSQLWLENGSGEIVNANSGLCLDDPGGNTAPGTQLIAYACNGQSNQEWAPPGGSAAVTSFGQILSVQSSGSSQLCLSPGAAFNAPINPGSNVLLEYATSGVCTLETYLWAVGSNGWIMANGTNSLCMDADGPATTVPGGGAAYFIQMQYCDGSQSQVWKVVSTYVGPELQNAADGLCLNTPTGQLVQDASAIVTGCGSIPSAGELWTLPRANHPPLKILPFGDSITYGIDSSTGGGYRCDLLSDLGTGTQMVGSQVAGGCAQPDNEGHPGWTIEGLQSIENCTITGYEPNVVLLDAGTNDVNVNTPSVMVAGGDPTHAANALENLVASIRDDDPGVVVVVGGLIPTTVAQTAANMTSFNQQVSAWITQQQGAGWHVGWADMSAVQLADLSDGLHPNDTGYQLMATAWSGAIDQAVTDGWVQSANAPTGSGCASAPTTGPPAPVWQAQGLIAPGVQGYAPPLWSAQGEVAPGVQGSGWTDALGQEIRFASLGYSSREDYLFIRPDSSVLGWRNDGPAPGGGYTWAPLGLVAPGIQGSGYTGPQDGQIQFADLTGNGKADYVWVHTDGTLSVWVNSGIGSNGDPVWTGPVNAWGPQNAPPGYNGSGSIQFADLTGDGQPDYLWVQPDGSIHWWKSGLGGLANHTWNDDGTIPSVGAPGSEIKFGYAFGGRQEDMLVVAPDSSVQAYVLNLNNDQWRPEGEVAPGIQGSGYTGPNDGDIDFANLSGDGNGLPGTGRDDYVWVRPDSSALMWQNITGAGLDNQIHFANLEPGSKKTADYVDISPLDGSITGWINGGPAPGGGYTWIPQGNVFAGVTGYAGPGNGSAGNIQIADVTSASQSSPDVLYIQPDGSVQGWAMVGTSDVNVALGTVVPTLANGYDGTGEIQFADMTGSGVDDYLWVRPDSSVMMWQNAYPNWTPVGEIAPGVQASGWDDSLGQYIRFADITGSGRADYLFIRPDSSVLAWYNPGPSANYNWESMGLIAPGVQGSGWVTGTPGNQVEFADMTGDGRADYLWVRPDTSVLMWQNTPG